METKVEDSMKRDGRTLDHKTLEEMRLIAAQRMSEGERPAAVAASFGLHRSWAFKCRAAVRGRGRGLKVLRSRQGTGRAARSSRWPRWGALLARLDLTAQKPLQRAYQRDPEAIERWQRELYPAIVKRAKKDGADIYFWDESGFRADSVHGKTWGVRGQTPVLQVPGQRQSIGAASAVSAKGAFWFVTYQGGLNGELFVEMLKKLCALESGAKDFISKPFDPAELLSRVHNMLEVRLLHDETRNQRNVLKAVAERLTQSVREEDAARIPADWRACYYCRRE